MQSLFASTLSVAVGFAFFDALSFQQYAATSFLLLGLSGAAWRLSQITRRAVGSSEGPGGVRAPEEPGGAPVEQGPLRRGASSGRRGLLDRPPE